MKVVRKDELIRAVIRVFKDVNDIYTFSKVFENSIKVKVVTIPNTNKTVSIVKMGKNYYSVENELFSSLILDHLYEIPDKFFNQKNLIHFTEELSDEDKCEMKSELKRWGIL